MSTTIPSALDSFSTAWLDLIQYGEQRMNELFAVIEDPDMPPYRKLAAEMELQHVAPLAGLRTEEDRDAQ